MTTALATQDGQVPARMTPMPEVMERIIAMGDLARLAPQDRIAYYQARCDAAGLDPRTQPFEYITLSGKLTLYAKKGASDQLIANHRLTVKVLRRGFDPDMPGCYVVECQAAFPHGQAVEDVGSVFIPEKMTGDMLSNQIMRCVTKAKRRTVLSACGLGMLDETEVETIPGASTIAPAAAPEKPPAPDNKSGFGRGQYASDEQTEAYLKNLDAYLAKRDQKWLDRWTDKHNGEVPKGLGELCNRWQADNHLVKWAIETGRLDPASMPDDRGVKNRQIGRYTGIIYHRSKAERKALTKELERYVDQQEGRQEEVIRGKNPHLFEVAPVEVESEAVAVAHADDEWDDNRE